MSLKKITTIKSCLFIVILYSICEIKCASVPIGPVIEGNETQQIKNLEKEKSALYNQLNDAIVDTIQTLEKTNDSDAKQGIQYMNELQALVDSFNGTEFEQQNEVCNGTKECIKKAMILQPTNSNFSRDARRQLIRRENQGYDHVKHAIIKQGLFKTEDQLNKIKEEKVRNLLRLQKKLDVWMQLRETEKQKIKLYKARQVSSRHDSVTEECPNYGESKNKGKKNTGMKKYPCCRKCCKKSYLGCL